MAKVTPSSLITAIQGKWAGMTFQMWKGVITARQTPHPHQTPKLSRALYKGAVSTIAGCFDRLTTAQSTGWDCYADLLPSVMTGFNAFLARNTTLLLAQHEDLKAYFNAPNTFSRPTSPTPFCVDYCTISDAFCLSWTDPTCTDFYVQGYYDPQAGFSNLKSPSWRLLQTVRAAESQMSLDGSIFPAGTVIRFKVRTINKWGETSFVPSSQPSTAAPSIRVLFPNGGEELYIDYTYTIYYQSANVNLVKIEYQTMEAGEWNTISAATAATGSFPWTIPEDTSVACKIKVTDLSQLLTFDISDNVFTITSAPSRSLTLTSPNGGEDWEVASQHNITWTSNNVNFIQIEYSTDNGGSWDPVIASTSAGPGSFLWTIPNEPSAICLIRITSTTHPSVTDTSAGTFTISSAELIYFFVTDRANHRIMKRLKSDLSFDSKVGAQGSGNNEFEYPLGICCDDTHMYICDKNNNRIVKRLLSDLSYVTKIGSMGAGNDQFSNPRGICVDGTHIYVADTGNDRIVKRLKSNLAYVSKFGTQGAGDNQFNDPSDICSDNTYLYITDSANDRIKKHLKSDLTYYDKTGTAGSGDNQFEDPRGIDTDNTHIFIVDRGNHRIMKRLCSNLTYVSKIGTQDSGNDNFDYPEGICVDSTHLFIADTNNNRLFKRLKSTLAYVAKIGSAGVGNDQFNAPAGTAG